jgi:hypothetical protein
MEKPRDEHLLMLGSDCAVAVLERLIANYHTDRDEIPDSDLDDEQPINIRFRGTLRDIRNARKAIACLKSADASIAALKATARLRGFDEASETARAAIRGEPQPQLSE